MIPAGHSVVDCAGIVELHGLSWRQGRRVRPWTRPGHPPPITAGRPTNGRPQLWDFEQAEQFARGEDVTRLPTAIDGSDLLDRIEAAEWAGVNPVAWERDLYRSRVPPPDQHLLGGKFWYRSTVDAYRCERKTVRRGGGRPEGSVESVPRGQLRQRVRGLLREAVDSGVPMSTAEIARRLNVHYTTAHRHVAAVRAEQRDEDPSSGE